MNGVVVPAVWYFVGRVDLIVEEGGKVDVMRKLGLCLRQFAGYGGGWLLHRVEIGEMADGCLVRRWDGVLEGYCSSVLTGPQGAKGNCG